MGLFWGSNKYLKEGPGVTAPPPKTGWQRYLYIFGTHLGKLVRLNLLMILFAFPIVTFPAAITAANRVLVLLLRDGHCFLWTDFWKEFKHSFWRSMKLGLFLGLFLALGLYCAYISWNGFVGLTRSLSFGFSIAVAAFAWTFGSYSLVFNAIYDQPAITLLRNAVMMAFIAIKPTLLILGLGTLVAAGWLLFPYSLPVIVLISTVAIQLGICQIVSTAVRKYINQS